MKVFFILILFGEKVKRCVEKICRFLFVECVLIFCKKKKLRYQFFFKKIFYNLDFINWIWRHFCFYPPSAKINVFEKNKRFALQVICLESDKNWFFIDTSPGRKSRNPLFHFFFFFWLSFWIWLEKKKIIDFIKIKIVIMKRIYTNKQLLDSHDRKFFYFHNTIIFYYEEGYIL